MTPPRAAPIVSSWALLLVGLAACAGSWDGGIHARMAYSGDAGLRVVETPADGPAQRGGLRPGDRILAIDGETVAELPLRAVIERLRGPVGTVVRLSIDREGAPLVLEIERAPYR